MRRPRRFDSPWRLSKNLVSVSVSAASAASAATPAAAPAAPTRATPPPPAAPPAAAAASATVPPPAAPARSLFTRARFVDRKRPAIKLGSVELRNRLLSVFVAHLDKAEALRPPCVTVRDYVC